jgi:hypothetical protein
MLSATFRNTLTNQKSQLFLNTLKRTVSRISFNHFFPKKVIWSPGYTLK